MEQYKQIFCKQDDRRIKPGESFDIEFDFEPGNEKEYRIFFTGETDMSYLWKSEYCCTPVYKRISESLVAGKNDAWGLKMTGADYPQICFRKQVWPSVLGYLSMKPTDDFTFGIDACGKNIKILPGGYLHIMLEIRYKKSDDMFKRHTKHAPDEVVTVNMPEGSFDETFTRAVKLPYDRIANVCYYVEGEKFTGEVVFEKPSLATSGGWELMPGFAPDTAIYQSLFNWFGVNLSKGEWPKMQISVNGDAVFADEFFERCHRYSEKEVTIPSGKLKSGKNVVSFKLISDWHDAIPYRLHEVSIVSEDMHSFDIVSCPETVTHGSEFAVMLDIRNACKLTVKSDAEVISATGFDDAGLKALRFRCPDICHGFDISISDGKTVLSASVKRVVEREDDGVITGTGDLIYISQDETDTKNYIKWYFSNHIGNLMTIRPTYRWSSSRVCNGAMWEKYVKLMNDMGEKYSHMVDGREPQGYTANPSLSQLGRDTGMPSCFLGRQLHERDGAYGYWGAYENPGDFRDLNRHYDVELQTDIYLRMRRLDPEHAGSEYYVQDMYDDGKRYWLCHDPSLGADMEVQAKSIMKTLSDIRNDSTRHTGPSIWFKYFYMSGYDWVGAETMDSPTEFLMSGLRGAIRAFGKRENGVHHALQWSTTPHEGIMRYYRYRLAVYVTWMQGATEINTEEGLWRMEEYYNYYHRFTEAAKSHLKMQQDFYRWVSSHSRQGDFHAPVAVMYGRYDGYSCFGGSPVWGRPKTMFNSNFDAEQSWAIPQRLFYPTNKAFIATKHNCTTGPIGLVSGTPRGCFDIVPVEKPIRDSYKLLAYFSYNKAENDDLDRLLDRISDGATALMTLAHLSCTTDREKIEAYELEFNDHKLFAKLGINGAPTFTLDSVNGVNVPIADIDATDAEVVSRTDSGRPIIVCKKVGRGCIYLFCTKLYPANVAIKDAYSSLFSKLTDEINAAESVFPIVGDDVQACVYDQTDGSKQIYFLAVDWWNDPTAERKAAIRINGKLFAFTLPLGILKKAAVAGDRAILCESETADVLAFDGRTARLQGEGIESYTVYDNGNVKTVNADFTDNSVSEISL